MDQGAHRRWWMAGVRASVAAALVVALGWLGVPWAAQQWGHPMLVAMAAQAHWLNWAAVLLLAIGWGDSAIAYRVRRRRPS